MKRRNAGIMLSFVIATLVLAVGYALVTDINLSISGTASAAANDKNFNVELVVNSMETTGTTTGLVVTDTTQAVSKENGQKQLNASFSVTGFTAKDDKAVVTYTIENTSNDLSALLSSTGVTVSVPESNGEQTYYADGANLFTTKYYFGDIESTKTTTVSSETLANTTTVTIVITLNETIHEQENVLVNINMPITAEAQ